MRQRSSFFSRFGSAWFSASSDRLHVQRWRENGGTVVDDSSSFIISDIKIVFCDGKCDPLYAKLKNASILVISSSWISCCLNLGHVVSFDPFILLSNAPSLLTPVSFGCYDTHTILTEARTGSAYTYLEPSTTSIKLEECSVGPENRVVVSCVAKVADERDSLTDKLTDEEEERIVKCLIGLGQDEPPRPIKLETSPSPSLAKTLTPATIRDVKIEEKPFKEDLSDPRSAQKKHIRAKLRSGLTMSPTAKEKTRAKRHLKNLITRSI